MKLCDLRNVATRFAVLTSLLFAAGCDTTGQYNVRVSEAANSVGKGGGGAAGNALLFGQESALGNPVFGYLKLPQTFGAGLQTLQAQQPRALPPFLKFPGFLYSYEVPVNAAGKNMPVYAYFGVLPLGNQTLDQLATAIQAEITTGMPGGNVTVLPGVQLPGSQFPFTRITATGSQAFDGSGMGGANENADGRFDLFIHQSATQLILVGWRVPTAAAGGIQFVPAVDAAMGTFRPEGAAAPGNQPVAAGRPVGGIDNVEVNWAYNFPDRTLTVKGKDGNYVLNATVANGQPIQQQGTLNQILAKLDQLPPQLANEVAACKKSYADLQAMLAPK